MSAAGEAVQKEADPKEKETGESQLRKEGGREIGRQLGEASAAQIKNTQQTTLSRDNILSFANQIRESIQNYKPPFTRLSLELNPKELGKVELTITQKGKDLQISITSNAQAITLFAQNQQDLRQSLQNIGFEQVDMNFSQNGGNRDSEDSQGKQRRNKNGLQSYEQISHLGEESFDTLEIRLPKYA